MRNSNNNKMSQNKNTQYSQLPSFALKNISICSSFLSLKIFIFIILHLLLVHHVGCTPTVTITSGSSFVGISTNYSVTISNHNNPNQIMTQFSAWTPWQSQPYASNYQYYLTSGSYSNSLLTCRIIINGIIQCNFPSGLGSTIQLTITSINNPSSTKPYNITFIFIYSDGSQVPVSSNLIVTNIRTTSISIINYNAALGSTSSGTNWVFSFDYYFDYGTILQISYIPSLIAVNFATLSGVSVINTTTSGNTTKVMLSNWADTNSGLKVISSIFVTNPQAAINVTIPSTLYFISSNVTYNIQSYTLQLSINPVTFNSVTLYPNLQLGLANQKLQIQAFTCPYTANNLSVSNISYTNVNFKTSSITQSSCATETIISENNTKTCTYPTSTFPKAITGITQIIQSNAYTDIIITSFTYFAPLASYYPLCNQTFSISLIPQQLSTTNISFDLTKCGAEHTLDYNNNTVIGIHIGSVATGDIVIISGLSVGGPVGNGWNQISGQSSYRYTLSSGNIINSSYVSISFPYTNPSYITTSNNISNITVSRMINSTQIVYATISPSSNQYISICPVTLPADLSSFSFSLSSYTTYEPNVTCNLQFRNKISDYQTSDYISIVFKNYDNALYLTSPSISPNIKSTLSTTSSNTNNSITVVNNTVLNIYNISSLNTNTNFISTLKIMNLINPAAIYPLNNADNAYSIVISLMSSSKSTPKQQYTIMFSSNTTSTAYSYLPALLNTQQNIYLPILTASSIAFNFTNKNKYTYYQSSSLPSSFLSLKLPFTCRQTNLTNLQWNAFTQYYSLALTECVIGYLLSTNATLEIQEYIPINSNTSILSLSSSTKYSIILQCNNNCQVCDSKKYCTQCANSTFTSSNLLYNGLCYSSCPASTYLIPNQTKCGTCHRSCLTCTGSSIKQCTTCPQYYTNLTTNISTNIGQTLYGNICGSICGERMYYNSGAGKCTDCEINCKYCIDGNYCYVCKTNATMVGNGLCEFTLCNSPCGTCVGNMDNCTSCKNGMYLYESTCLSTCPKNTYPKSEVSQGLEVISCIDIKVPTLYFPATICAIVLICLVCICNTCIEKGLTADKFRRNINLLTYSSSILAYMQLFALLIMLAFTMTASSKGLGITGLIIWIICNILFGIYYWKVIKDDESVNSIVNKMTSKSKCIYYATVICSIVITMRTYRVLYCGLFRGVAPFTFKKKAINPEQNRKERKYSDAKIANQDIEIRIQQQANIKSSPLKNGKNTSLSNKTVKNMKQPQPAVKKQDSNPLPNIIYSQSETSSQQQGQQHSRFQLKRPQIIYITLGTIFGSILYLVAAVIEIVSQTYAAMLFSGLDLMIIVIASIIVTCLDMWAGIKKSYLMALEKRDANQTIENLRAQEDGDQQTQQKMLFTNKVTQKLNKVGSPNKRKLSPPQPPKPPTKKKYVPPKLTKKASKSPASPKSQQKNLSPQQKQFQQKANKMKKVKSRYTDLYKRSKKTQQQSQSENETQQIPDIKVFEDIQIFANDGGQPIKKSKKIKADHKRMTSMNNMRRTDAKNFFYQSNANFARGTKMSWKMDDIFLGFKDAEDDFDQKTIKLGSNNTNQGRQIYNIVDKKFQKSDKSDNEEQPSYIKSLQRKKQQDKEEIKSDLSEKDQHDIQDTRQLSPAKKQKDNEDQKK